MLSGSEIIKCVKDGRIEIDPFDKDRVNPNSYNLRIGNHIQVYKNFFVKNSRNELIFKDNSNSLLNPFGGFLLVSSEALDPKKENEVYQLTIPEGGFVLYPNILYLASTIERTFTKEYVPCISGRSSYARLGLEVHQTAGFGDVGVDLNWTLELSVIHPLRIYPNTEICQVYFEEITGDKDIQYSGKYQNQRDVVASKSFIDFK